MLPNCGGDVVGGKVLFAWALILISGVARADIVVLQNLNSGTLVTQGSGDNLGFNIRFNTTNLSSNLSRIILFGTAGQSITGNFDFSGVSSAVSRSATEVVSGQYSFDLSTMPGASSMPAKSAAGGGYILEVRGLTVGTQLYVASSATMTTVNSSGFEGVGYNGPSVQFQFTSAVPEPSTLFLTGSVLAAGAVGAWIKRRRSNSPSALVESESEGCKA